MGVLPAAPREAGLFSCQEVGRRGSGVRRTSDTQWDTPEGGQGCHHREPGCCDGCREMPRCRQGVWPPRLEGGKTAVCWGFHRQPHLSTSEAVASLGLMDCAPHWARSEKGKWGGSAVGGGVEGITHERGAGRLRECCPGVLSGARGGVSRSAVRLCEQARPSLGSEGTEHAQAITLPQTKGTLAGALEPAGR